VLGVTFFVVMLNAGMLSVVMLNVVMLSVLMLSVVMPSVIMLSVVMLSVMAPIVEQIGTIMGFSEQQRATPAVHVTLM
jgi:hypothetical protein